MPRSVTITGKVSDSPLGQVAVARNKQQLFVSDDVIPDTLPTQDAIAMLEDLWEHPQLVTIVTSLRTYNNMVMSACSIPREAKDGESVTFTCTFDFVRQITNERTTVRVAAPIAAAPLNKGPLASKNDDLVPRMVDQNDGAWYDPDINGWRYGASFNGTNWEFFKGTPTTQPPGLTDAQYLAGNQQGLVPLDKKPDGSVVAVPGAVDYSSAQTPGAPPPVAQNAGQQVQVPTNSPDVNSIVLPSNPDE